jgi:hypothetical protein
MITDIPLVFLLEDSFVVGAQIERAILTRVPECRLLWARRRSIAVGRRCSCMPRG